MNRIARATGFAACFLAMLVLVGGHWWALQTVAWVRMVTDYSQRSSITSAVEQTLSGEHPCALCLKIQQCRQQEDQKSKKIPGARTEKLPELLAELSPVAVPGAPFFPDDLPTSLNGIYSDFTESPPPPPPRAA